MALNDYLIIEDPTARGLAEKVKALMPARQPFGGVAYNPERQTFAQVVTAGTPNGGGGGGGGEGMNWRGAYDGTVSYTDGDAASFMGSSWLATVDHPANDGVAPTDDGTTPNAGWAALALKGATGPKGATGAKGDTGAPGKDGADGAKGAKGDTGAKGDPGADGKDGATGAKGDKGDKGDTGAKGDKGDKGDTGAKGDPGKDATITPAAYVDPASESFAADLVAALQAAGLMADGS